MAESIPPRDGIESIQGMTTDEMIDRSENWKLSCDNALLNRLKQFSKSITETSQDITRDCDSLSIEINDLQSQVVNVTNEFLMLSNTQFIENRVQDFIEISTEPKTSPLQHKSKTEKEEELISKMKEAIQIGLHVDKNCDPSSKYSITTPHLIGSSKFYSSQCRNILVNSIKKETSMINEDDLSQLKTISVSETQGNDERYFSDNEDELTDDIPVSISQEALFNSEILAQIAKRKTSSSSNDDQSSSLFSNDATRSKNLESSVKHDLFREQVPFQAQLFPDINKIADELFPSDEENFVPRISESSTESANILPTNSINSIAQQSTEQVFSHLEPKKNEMTEDVTAESVKNEPIFKPIAPKSTNVSEKADNEKSKSLFTDKKKKTPEEKKISESSKAFSPAAIEIFKKIVVPDKTKKDSSSYKSEVSGQSITPPTSNISSKKEETISPPNLIPANKTNGKQSLFDDSDSDGDLFSSKSWNKSAEKKVEEVKGPVSEKKLTFSNKKLFDSDSDDDLFSPKSIKAKASGTSGISPLEKPKVLVNHSLFDDSDSDDGLFSSTKIIQNKKIPESPKASEPNKSLDDLFGNSSTVTDQAKKESQKNVFENVLSREPSEKIEEKDHPLDVDTSEENNQVEFEYKTTKEPLDQIDCDKKIEKVEEVQEKVKNLEKLVEDQDKIENPEKVELIVDKFEELKFENESKVEDQKEEDNESEKEKAKDDEKKSEPENPVEIDNVIKKQSVKKIAAALKFNPLTLLPRSNKPSVSEIAESSQSLNFEQPPENKNLLKSLLKDRPKINQRRHPSRNLRNLMKQKMMTSDADDEETESEASIEVSFSSSLLASVNSVNSSESLNPIEEVVPDRVEPPDIFSACYTEPPEPSQLSPSSEEDDIFAMPIPKVENKTRRLFSSTSDDSEDDSNEFHHPLKI